MDRAVVKCVFPESNISSNSKHAQYDLILMKMEANY